MDKVIQKIKRYLKQRQGRKPSPLPVGVSEFLAYVKELETTYDLPTKNRDDILFAVTTTILHLGPQESKKPKQYFVDVIRAGAAKQIAAHYFQETKLRQKAAEDAAKQAALAVVPAQPAESGPTK